MILSAAKYPLFFHQNIDKSRSFVALRITWQATFHHPARLAAFQLGSLPAGNAGRELASTLKWSTLDRGFGSWLSDQPSPVSQMRSCEPASFEDEAGHQVITDLASMAARNCTLSESWWLMDGR